MDKFCEDFKTKYHKVYDADKAELLDHILTFADCKHKGQTRASGEPYIDHPVAVADILLDLGLDSDSWRCHIARHYRRHIGNRE